MVLYCIVINVSVLVSSVYAVVIVAAVLLLSVHRKDAGCGVADDVKFLRFVAQMIIIITVINIIIIIILIVKLL